MRVEYEALAQNDVVVATSGMTISRLQGYFNGGANAWLQLHDAKATPADTAVPLRVWPLYTAAPFDQNFQNDPIAVVNGCVFVVSSTQATLTISASTMDIFVNGEKASDTVGVTVVGDYTTGVEDLEVWAQASPGKKLLRLEVTDTAGGVDVYVQVHAKDAPTNGSEKPLLVFPLAGMGSIDIDFGGGYTPMRASGTSVFLGCRIVISSIETIFNAVGSTDYTIKATYK